MADIFREPLVTPIPKRAAILPDWAPNLLLTTLAVIATTAPFYQIDWQNPVARRITPQADSFSGVTTRGIPPAIAAPLPFSNTDWPIIRRLDASGAQSLELTAYQPTAVAPAPFLPVELPIPARARAVQDFSQSGTTTRGIPPAVIVNPFGPVDLGQPSRARYAQIVDSVPNALVFGIPQPFPFALADWPQPFRARSIAFDVPPNVAINSPLVATAPFRQSEHANPPLRARVVPYAEVGPNTMATGIAPPPPWAQSDWPSPVRARQILADNPPNLLVSFPLSPFAQFEWVTPSRKVAPQIDSPTNQVVLGFPAIVAPFYQSEWVNPLHSKWISHDSQPSWVLGRAPAFIQPIHFLIVADYQQRVIAAVPQSRLTVAPSSQRIVTGG